MLSGTASPVPVLLESLVSDIIDGVSTLATSRCPCTCCNLHFLSKDVYIHVYYVDAKFVVCCRST